MGIGPYSFRNRPGHWPFSEGQLNGYKVRAQSEGSAILLLPIEFSRCLTVSSRVDGPPPRLFRADLVLTGVLFDRRLDADISFRVGPGEASRCRVQDANDAEHMQIRNAWQLAMTLPASSNVSISSSLGQAHSSSYQSNPRQNELDTVVVPGDTKGLKRCSWGKTLGARFAYPAV